MPIDDAMGSETENVAAEETAQDRPETLASALGEDGDGIVSEIESELAANSDAEGQAPEYAEPIASTELHQQVSERLGLLSDVGVTLSARLCSTTKPLGEVLALKQGSVLDLGRATSQPIELLANGVLVAYGEVVAVGDNLGVRVTGMAGSSASQHGQEKLP